MTVSSPKNTFQSPEVRVVEASAGSGKTYALAKRYVQLILNPALKFEQVPIRNILALTFTNKAAFEMKERILEFLKKIALKQLPKNEAEDILKPLGLNTDAASRQAFAAMDGVIRHYNFFQVQTIDKFINALLSGCAFRIGLTANFKIKTNAGEYLEYSLDQLIDRARREKDILRAFESFLHHYLYLENRSGWFPKDDMLAIITSLFEKSNTYGHDFRESPFAPDDVIKKKAVILEDIKALQGALPDGTHATFRKGLDKFLAEHAKSFDIDSLSDYFAREEIPVKKGTNVSDDLDGHWRKIRTAIEGLCEQEARSLFDPYIQMFAQTIGGFYDKAAKDDCLFLNELNKRTGLLFDEDHVTVEELYYRLATRFHHYLIDEFQDTSRLQWHNLEQMAEEALSTGGTLFYVGDRKQAIYGFRGGDERLFDEIRQAFDDYNVRTDLLTKNWRSQKQVVEFNNEVFSAGNLTRLIHQKQVHEAQKNKKAPVVYSDDDIAEVHHIFGSAQQTFKPENSGGYVQIEPIDIDLKEERDEVIRTKVTALVRDLKKRFTYKDIAILTRGNQQIKEITNWLLEEDIPVESERTSDITENTVIRELISFLQFLNSPIDNLAFTAFILGDLFPGATGLKKEELHHFVFGLRGRLANEKDLYVYTEFRSHYPEIWNKYIEEFFGNVGLYPLYELIITIYSRFDILNRCGDIQGFLMHFLELVKKAEEDHSDLASFLEYFENLQGEDLYVHVTDSDAVKVMTVHKAKGLEFPVVILPYLGMDVQIGASSGEYQPSYILQEQDDKLGLLRIKTKYLKYSDNLYRIYSREYKKAFLSELNNIYVALTRPKNELYGFIPKRIGNSFNCARFLFPDEICQRGKQQTYKAEVPTDETVFEVPPSDYPDWIGYLKDEFLEAGQLINRSARLRGEVMHYLLSFIGDLSGADRTQAVEQALTEGAFRFPQVEEWEVYKQRMGELLNAPPMRKYFYCDGADVFTEREIINARGHTKRCDRLVVRDGEVWIIDYKSSRDAEGKYQEQVIEYKEIMRDIYPDKEVKAFLIYLDGMEIEIV